MQFDYILINRNELADLVTKAVRDALQQKRQKKNPLKFYKNGTFKNQH